MTVFDHLIIFAFAVIYPLYDAFYSSPRFKKNITDNKPGARTHEYLEGIIWIWFFSILVISLFAINKRDLGELGLDFSMDWTAWAGVILMVIGAVCMIYLYYSIDKDKKQYNRLKTKKNSNQISVYLPRTSNEFLLFIVVAISAGICEELLFRGFLIWYINGLVSMYPAAILSSVIFGLAHYYQGWKGVIQSGILGFFFAMIYIFTGTLWILIALHVIIDIYSGMLGRLAFKEKM